MNKRSNGIIKSLLSSKIELNPKNINYEIVKDILQYKDLDLILNKNSDTIRNIITYYKKEIINDKFLKDYSFYYNKCLDVRNNRLSQVLKGDYNKVAFNKLKNSYTNEELEKNFKDRGMQHFKIKNDTIPIKIIDKEQLMYVINIMKLDTIKGVLTNIYTIDSLKLDKWYMDMENYSKSMYNIQINKSYNSYIFLGENNIKKEEVYLYYCLNDAKIYIVKKTTLHCIKNI